MSHKMMLHGSLSAAAMLLGGAAQAQTAAPDPAVAPAASPAAAPAGGAGLGDIVVTARRQQERLQDVPVAVTAFNQQTLTRNAINSGFDLAKVVPGLTVEADSGNAGLPTFSIRGRGQNYGAAAGSVETYFADVPLSAPFQMPTLPVQLFDLSSFQVLKGPQGTLFGRSTTGGAVLIVPQAPTDEYGGYARIQGGTYNDFQFEGAANIPLVSDKVLLRVAAFHWNRDGYMRALSVDPVTGAQVYDNETGRPLQSQRYDNEDTTDVRATLLIKPSDNFSNSTIFTYHMDQEKTSTGSGLMLDASGNTVPEPGYKTYTTYTDISFRKPVSNSFALINTSTLDLSEAITLKNIFGYIYANGYTNDAEDSDGTVQHTIDVLLPPRSRINRQYTDEVQLQGKAFDQRLSWTIGGLADLTREPGRDGDVSKMNFASYNGSSVFGLDPAHPNAAQIESRYQSNNNDSYGLYGAGTFKITDKLGISGGFRHNWDTVRATQAQTLQDSFYTPFVLQGVQKFEAKFQSNVYNAGIDYHPTQHVMLYGGYRHGFKRGGFNSSSTNANNASFAPEKIDDFYAGAKTDFRIAGMRGRFNVEGFYDFYKGYQVSYLSAIFVPAFNLVTITTNVPKTIYRGGEMELTLEPTRWLELDGSYSYTDAFFRKFPDNTLEPAVAAAGLPSLAVNNVTYNSRNKYTVSARIHGDLPDDKGEIVFQPRVSYQSRFFTTPFNVKGSAAQEAVFGPFNNEAHGGAIVPKYTLLDLRLEWNHFLGSRFDLAANATNVTDKVYFLGNSGTLNFGVQGNAYGAPRMFTFEVSTKF